MSQAHDPIRLEFTPNPNTLKYVLARQLLPRGTANFLNKQAAETSPLAHRLFDVAGVEAVMVGPTFVTVTMTSDADAALLNDGVHTALHAHLDSGEHPVDPSSMATSAGGSDDDPVVAKIRAIIEDEVRPAVAMDGGDITFERFQDGVVYVYMMGSCSSCPSSTATLKMGIESRLREEIPEVVQVVQI
ncbi:NifU family protein [Vulgatibacter incomptus]|uniref:NifU-like domain protein n=1 Tax=Vulgatibacter incomptus TaxID=1391653 RepID=A0A0K1PI64_9BACT|nr:NifU family protein [Vulgatibacter incomptus]AKU92799.1 NifU-like domain protein [Vulgatibacter incomptus]